MIQGRSWEDLVTYTSQLLLALETVISVVYLGCTFHNDAAHLTSFSEKA